MRWTYSTFLDDFGLASFTSCSIPIVYPALKIAMQRRLEKLPVIHLEFKRRVLFIDSEGFYGGACGMCVEVVEEFLHDFLQIGSSFRFLLVFAVARVMQIVDVVARG
jgi:hypothetical protein